MIREGTPTREHLWNGRFSRRVRGRSICAASPVTGNEEIMMIRAALAFVVVLAAAPTLALPPEGPPGSVREPIRMAAPAMSAKPVGPGYDIEMSRMIPMRDGVELEAWIFKPSNLKGKAPAMLELTQYDIDGGFGGGFATFVRRGYVFVQVLVRGRGRSGGVKSDSLGLQVGRDGYDVVEWIAAQPWSDGHVVMYGASFFGMTQWRTAAQNPPHLGAIAPYVSIYPGWDVPNTNGIPQAFSAVIMGLTSGRQLNTGFLANRGYWAGKMLEEYAAYRPFRELDDAVGIAQDDWWMVDERGKKLSFMKMWLDHVGDRTFNLAAEPKVSDYAAMHFPILSATGYFDDDQPGALRYYRGHIAHAPAAAVAKHYLIIGPWDHLGTHHPVKEIEGLAIPDAAVIDMNKLRADWYDYALGRGPRPALLHDRVTYFMLGADEWRYAKTLEAASSGKDLTFFLDAPEGTPEDVFHSGSLARKPPGAEPPAVVVSDPHELPELEVVRYARDENLTSQFRDFQKRAIVFHSEPFPQDVEVAGQMRLNLKIQADAPDFDLWAQVLMVLPDGSTVQLGEDIRRARFRDDPFKQELLRPDQIAEIPFEFRWMARRIPAGARLRLTIAPLNSPAYQKNYNTGGRIGYEKLEDARIARIKVFHDGQRASRLVLPLAAPAESMDGTK
ncbi:MAG TPA: CocE/NonD family hydrolase [Thermoanaerobaculia bacterium]|nr:CocE/NonD family hydrolase [Thermoanaerobaculia bacterium]